MFISNDSYLRDFHTEMVAVPDDITVTGRRNINSYESLQELYELNEMSLNANSTRKYFEDYLAKYQVQTKKSVFKLEYPISPGVTSGSEYGENTYSIIEGRKNVNLECFAIIYDPSSFS